MADTKKVKKEYFSHNYGTRYSTKIIPLIKTYGYEGYGLYWCLFEELFEGGGELSLDEISAIAYRARIDDQIEKLEHIIYDFGLFEINEETNTFTASEIQEQLKIRAEKSELARQSVSKRWENEKNGHSDSPDTFSPYGQANESDERF